MQFSKIIFPCSQALERQLSLAKVDFLWTSCFPLLQLPCISPMVSLSHVAIAPPCVPKSPQCQVSHRLLGFVASCELQNSHCVWQHFVSLLFTQPQIFSKLVKTLQKSLWSGQWDHKLQRNHRMCVNIILHTEAHTKDKPTQFWGKHFFQDSGLNYKNKAKR